MKNILKRLFLCLLVVPFVFMFSACSKEGLSAYEIAVKNGFEGTEIEWLESLKGDKGDAGKDGEDGTNGDDGKDGKDSISSYKMWEEAFASGDTTLDYTDWVIENFDINFDGEKFAINKNLLSVVEVSVFTNENDMKINVNSKKSGSAVLYDIDENGDAYFVTNYHVVYYSMGVKKAYPYYRLEFYQDTFYYMPATFIGGSSTYDLAVLKVESENYLSDRNANEVTFSDSVPIAGTPVFAIGNTNGDGINISLGVIDIESEHENITIAGNTASHRLLRHDAYIVGGNSGGGLFDYNGNFVGITNGGSTTDEKIKYAIPADLVKKVAEQFIENYKADATSYRLKKCNLGLLTNVLATYPVFDTETELVKIVDVTRIEYVFEDSPLYEKVVAGDSGDLLSAVILQGIRYDLSRGYNLDELMLQARAGDTLSLVVLRGAEKVETTLDEIVLSSDLFVEVL